MKPKIALHPFLFSIYTILVLFQQNKDDILPADVIRPLFLGLILTGLVYWMINRYLKELNLSAFITTLWVFWMFYFGHIIEINSVYTYIGDNFEYRLIFLCLWTTLFIAAAYPNNWKRRNSKLIGDAFTVAFLVLVISPIYTVIKVAREISLQTPIMESRQARISVQLSSPSDTSPDIYYIIVDAYGRSDTLRTYQNLDNSEFMNYLHNKGFYVADRAQSNYMQTDMSVSSSLNFQYISDLEKDFGDTTNRGPSTYLIAHSLIVKLLKDQGYKLVNVESFMEFMRLHNADVYLAPAYSSINQFESLILTLSPASLFTEKFMPSTPLVSYESHRNYIKFELSTLSDIPKLDGKKFIFAHVLSPHPPFIFDEHGNAVEPNRPYTTSDGPAFPGTQAEYNVGYKNQTIYLNTLLEMTIDNIIANSKRPVIIILQGDHGPGPTHKSTSTNTMYGICLQERFANLNAYYFPDKDYTALSPDMTPVNTFRVVLNQYFGANLEIQKNMHYFSPYDTPFNFEDVTLKTNQACQDPP